LLKSYFSRKGSIFFTAIWILVFFSILSVSIYKIASSQIKAGKVLRERVISRYLAKAAVIYASIERENDFTSYDTLYELRRPHQKELVNGKFIYKLIDEESKINVNKVSKDILKNLPGLDEKLAEAIFKSKLRPFKSKEEILLVEGITEEIFNQFKDYITVYGEGKVNINTASEEVLKILGMDDDLIKIIKDYRAGPDGEEVTEDDGVFESENKIISNLRDFTGLFLEQETLLLQLISKNLLGVSSQYFSLEVTTYLANQPTKTYAILMDKEKVYCWQERNT
jgi:general secretion pathway protein K